MSQLARGEIAPPEPLVHRITQDVCTPYREIGPRAPAGSGLGPRAKWENHDTTVMDQWLEIDKRVRAAIEAGE